MFPVGRVSARRFRACSPLARVEFAYTLVGCRVEVGVADPQVADLIGMSSLFLEWNLVW